MGEDQATQTATNNPSGREARALVAVAGVGASAGGIAATSELLRQLGPRPGIAIVVVHHLDPTHESSLVDIFAKVTALPVEAVHDGMRVEPNHVYVVPPNAGIAITDGILKLTPRIETGGLHLPIDRFFQSLAADRTVRPIGVVLTGTGADGTIGIKAIKDDGGITFAQDASAEHRSMPESAIATESVDFVLPLDGIARELTRIGEPDPLLSSAVDDTLEFQRVLAALHKSSGVDFANYKHSTLRRRVQRRVVVNRLTSLRAYAELVEQDPKEARALSDEVLIHVTSFFRDPETFDTLKTLVFPRLLEGRPRGACIRVWIPGCSTGEEVYSIAISLLEFLADASAVGISIRLFGTDVSSATIDKARAGKYPASIEHEVSTARLQRFFAKLEGAYQIRKEVRDLCVFAKQDATRDPPFAGMDLISCRNVMIYLGSPLQDRLLPIFHYALKEPGFLVLGASETVRSFPGFATLDAKHRIYARSAAAPRLVLGVSNQRATGPLPDELLAPPSGAHDIHGEADRLVLAAYAPPGVVVTDDLAIVQFRGRTGPFLEPTPGVPSFDLLRMVREDLRLPLRQTIDEARAKQAVVRSVETNGAPGPTPGHVEIEVIPFRTASTTQRFFVVLFHEVAGSGVEHPTDAASIPNVVPSTTESRLRQELTSTRSYLQSVIEQGEAGNEELQTANEEIVSSNEELSSINEELQMAKEELQSTNEELSTLNDELMVRNLEVTRLNDDLSNVLSSVEVPILLLGRDSRVRRFTPAAGRLFELGAHAVGRPIGDVTVIVPAPELDQMIASVLQRLSPVESTAQDATGHWYQLTVRPYLTLDNRIDGTVITVFDIDAMKKAERLLGEAALQRTETGFREMLTSAAEPILMTDDSGRIVFANQMSAKAFGYTTDELMTLSVDALVPDAQRARHATHRTEFAADPSPRSMGRNRELTGRRKDGTEFPIEVVLGPMPHEGGALVVSFITDITERKAFDQALRDNQEQLRHMAFDAALTEERERRRIASDLHDSIGQSLALAQIKMTAMRESVTGAARAALDEAVGLVAQSVADTRTLIFELSPPVLYDLGLKEALSWLIDELEQRHGIRVALTDDGADKPLDEATASLVFRAVRELLANVFKHAKSPAANVSLRRTDDHLNIDVEDEGVGFDPNNMARPSSGGGFGLFSVREQISRLGGTVEIASEPGHGTRVSIRVPFEKKESS